MKYSSSGVQQWVKAYNGAKDSADVGNAIGLDAHGNVYVSGASTGKTSNYDFITLKYTSSGSPATLQNLDAGPMPVYNVPGESSQQFALYQNYPNPFSTSTRIGYYLPKPGNVHLTISDLQGHIVKEMQGMNMAAGRHSIDINNSLLSTGVYFYKLATDNFTETRRMTLAR